MQKSDLAPMPTDSTIAENADVISENAEAQMQSDSPALADQYPVNKFDNYHAHLYYDADSVAFAAQLREQIAEKFDLPVGRLHEKNVGPHPMWSCQITFASDDFDSFIPWLDENRNGLTVLVHGVTENALKDHTEHVYWLGEGVELDISIFIQ